MEPTVAGTVQMVRAFSRCFARTRYGSAGPSWVGTCVSWPASEAGGPPEWGASRRSGPVTAMIVRAVSACQDEERHPRRRAPAPGLGDIFFNENLTVRSLYADHVTRGECDHPSAASAQSRSGWTR